MHCIALGSTIDGMRNKIPKAFRLSENAVDLLTRLCEKLGLSQASVLEMSIRKLAEQEGVESDPNAHRTMQAE